MSPAPALAYATLAPSIGRGHHRQHHGPQPGSSAGISLLQAGVIRQSALAHQVLATQVVPATRFRAPCRLC